MKRILLTSIITLFSVCFFGQIFSITNGKRYGEFPKHIIWSKSDDLTITFTENGNYSTDFPNSTTTVNTITFPKSEITDTNEFNIFNNGERLDYTIWAKKSIIWQIDFFSSAPDPSFHIYSGYNIHEDWIFGLNKLNGDNNGSFNQYALTGDKLSGTVDFYVNSILRSSQDASSISIEKLNLVTGDTLYAEFINISSQTNNESTAQVLEDTIRTKSVVAKQFWFLNISVNNNGEYTKTNGVIDWYSDGNSELTFNLPNNPESYTYSAFWNNEIIQNSSSSFDVIHTDFGFGHQETSFNIYSSYTPRYPTINVLAKVNFQSSPFEFNKIDFENGDTINLCSSTGENTELLFKIIDDNNQEKNIPDFLVGNISIYINGSYHSSQIGNKVSLQELVLQNGDSIYAIIKNIGLYQTDFNAAQTHTTRTLVANSCITGITTKENKSLVIAPNPVTGILNIQLSEEGSFSLYNQLGELVFQSETINNIDLSAIETGVYFYQVQTTDKNYSGKILKK